MVKKKKKWGNIQEKNWAISKQLQNQFDLLENVFPEFLGEKFRGVVSFRFVALSGKADDSQ